MAGKTPAEIDIRDRERGFASFVRMLGWAVGIALAVLVFLALANA